MRILLLGSTLLTQRVEDRLLRFHYVVGHVPSRNPTIPGRMRSAAVPEDTPADLVLSVQYDRLWKRLPAFNLHTGILPAFGGCDVLWHTIQEGVEEQGLTFHAMTDRLDYGPIIATTTYPVFEDDTVVDLYRRMLLVAPAFAETCIDLAVGLGSKAQECRVEEPYMHRRGDVDDPEGYRKAGEELRRAFQ